MVEGVYTEGGFVLNKEAEIDLRSMISHGMPALSRLDDLNASDPHLVTLTVSALPKTETASKFPMATKRKFVFIAGELDQNSSDAQVPSTGRSRSCRQPCQFQSRGFRFFRSCSWFGSSCLFSGLIAFAAIFPSFTSSTEALAFRMQ